MQKNRKFSDMDLILDTNRTREKIPNKYEFIVVASRYAHIIARKASEENRYLRRKPFLMAVEDLLAGKVDYEKSL